MRQTDGRTICRSTQCLQALYKALKQYCEVSSFKFHKKQNKQTDKLTLFCSKRTKLSKSRQQREAIWQSVRNPRPPYLRPCHSEWTTVDRHSTLLTCQCMFAFKRRASLSAVMSTWVAAGAAVGLLGFWQVRGVTWPTCGRDSGQYVHYWRADRD